MAIKKSGIVLLLTCTAQFMVVLDIAIVNVALPSIQTDLGAEQSSLQWIVIAYGLMLGGFLLLGGRMADLLGRRRILLTGLVLFSLASLLAGIAGSAELLIGARALQGFGAALIPPTALSILAVTFAEGADRNRALGIYGAVAGVSGVGRSDRKWHAHRRPGLALDLPDQRPDRGRARRDSGDLPACRRSPPPRRTFRRRRRGHRDWWFASARPRAHSWRRRRLGLASTLGLFAASVAMLGRFREIERTNPVTADSRPRRFATGTLVAANLAAFLPPSERSSRSSSSARC